MGKQFGCQLLHSHPRILQQTANLCTSACCGLARTELGTPQRRKRLCNGPPAPPAPLVLRLLGARSASVPGDKTRQYNKRQPQQ